MSAAINQHIKESLLFRRRILLILFPVLICCLLVIGRLVYLQFIEHQFYASQSTKNLLDVVRLKPARGLIYDRNGVLLAKNISSYVLSVIPEKVPKLKQSLQTLQTIIPISQEELEFFEAHRYQYRPLDPIPLKSGLTEKEVYRFYVNQYRFPGIIVQPRTERYYPLGEFTSEILGYVAPINTEELASPDWQHYDVSDNIGKAGIERYYEALLHGKQGMEHIEINASGHRVRQLTKEAPIAGKNLYLTIDSQLQKKAHELLGNENGSIVAIKPSNGEILALVSHPGFDPNLFIGGISQRNYQKLLNSPKHPLYNLAISGQFAAGSTLKPFITLGSLDIGIINKNSKIYDPGWFQLPNTQHVYHDWKRSGHGWVNTTEAIEMSCDTFFYHLAPRLGINKLDKILESFGFGQKTGIDLPGEKAGLIPSPAWKKASRGESWYTGDTVETIIGQGFVLVTPLQLATATSILANRGQYFQPHLRLKTTNEAKQTDFQSPIKRHAPPIKQKQNWNTVIKAMQLAVDGRYGTAIYFGRNRGYSAAVKTGTAQIYGHSRDEERSQLDIPKRLRNNHLFIAFAPVEHPQIALAVVLEHSAYADKIAGQLIDFYLKKP